jgi:hypothetical protein
MKSATNIKMCITLNITYGNKTVKKAAIAWSKIDKLMYFPLPENTYSVDSMGKFQTQYKYDTKAGSYVLTANLTTNPQRHVLCTNHDTQ